MTKHIAITLSAVLIATAASVVPGEAQSCRPSTDAIARATLAWATAMATGSDAEAVATRSQLKIPSTTASKVALVTDAATCLKAVQAYAADGNFPPTDVSVYLVKVNTSYILKDPSRTIMDGALVSLVLDSKFKILSRFTG
jgi:hypothetical protein